MKAYRGSRIIVPVILNMWWCVVNFTPCPLYPQEGTPSYVEYEAGWAAETIWTYWRRETLRPPAGIRPHVCQPVTQSLYWLQCSSSPYWVSECVDKPTRCTTSYKQSLFFLFCSTCFGRTIRPSSGALSSRLYHAVGTFVQASLAATWL